MEVFYKRENEYDWRGPAKVVGVSGKTVIVKHGDSLREIARVPITRIENKTLEQELKIKAYRNNNLWRMKLKYWMCQRKKLQ